MSLNFEKIKTYYENGVWDKARVHNAVLKKIITKFEFEKITNEKYI